LLYPKDYYDLIIKENQTFSFYDTRNESCWVWETIEGGWQTSNDTIIFLGTRFFPEKKVVKVENS
jgi:hypothetical protein